MPDAYWAAMAAAIQRHVGTDGLERFLEWSSVTATMFVGPAAGYLAQEQAELLAADPERWSAVPVEFGGYPDSNLVHQAYHLSQWERHTGRRVGDLGRIAEIGGGYGAMARLCRRLGFAGDYVIYDLPAVTDLQQYYLAATGTAADCRSVFEGEACDLLIALYSLSEMGLATQQRYLAGMACQHFLIGVHDADWWGVDTHAPLDAHFWAGQRVEHPYLSGRYYLIG
jgi:hypothetical protein